MTNSLRSAVDLEVELVEQLLKSGLIILMSYGAYRAIEETRVIGNNGSNDLLQIW